MSKKKKKKDEEQEYVPASPKQVKELIKSLSMKTKNKKLRNSSDKLYGMEER